MLIPILVYKRQERIQDEAKKAITSFKKRKVEFKDMDVRRLQFRKFKLCKI